MDRELGTRIYVLLIALLAALASGCATPAPATHFIAGQLIAEMTREEP